jgi:CDP-paratose 2-epimerase
VLITGGAGFIGVHAARYWGSRGQVLIVDNLSRKGTQTNLEWVQGQVAVAFENVDIRDAVRVRETVSRFRPDLVLHLAGQVAVTTSVANPRLDFEGNALGTFNVLEAVREAAPEAALIYASTNKVYGGMEDVRVELRGRRYAYAELPHGASEERPLDFHSPYGCSKGAADQYVRDYARIYGLRTTVCRQSCIYGTQQFGVEDQGWVAWFTIATVLGRPITVYGDGCQVRDVLWVEDLIEAFAAIAAAGDRCRGQIYNLGGGPENTMSLLELLDLLETLNGRKPGHAFGDWRPGDQRVFVADIRKAERELAWRPKVGPAEGVRRLHAWVRENRALLTTFFR